MRKEIDHTAGAKNGTLQAIAALSPVAQNAGDDPLRRTYTHLSCGFSTTMGRPVAEAFARRPGFYTGTFCAHCRMHAPLSEFVWEGTRQKLN